jgi:DNA modification methylase
MTSFRHGVRYERVDIAWPKPSPRHARIHPPRQLRKLAKLLGAFGQICPLIVAPDGELIDGHAVLEVLKTSGQEQVDVVIVADQSPEHLRALRLALNRSSQDGLWDRGKLRKEIEVLLELSFDTELTGFDEAEIEFLFESEAPRDNVIEDASAIPPPPKTPITQPGDIYAAGDSRIGCGSALDLDFVNRVRGDRTAAACIIDPPYGLPTRFFSGRGKHKHPDFVQGAGEMSSAELCKFYQGALEVLRACSSPRALIFAFTDWRHSLEMTAAAQLIDLPLLNICVWVKTNPGMGSLYRSQHELVHLFKAGDEPHVNNVQLGRYGRSRSNVWHYAGVSSFGTERDELLALHPSVKPVRLLSDAIRDVTKRGDAVFDTFLGSGSTLIAVEETGRVCIGVDLDPRYVDVAILRWQKATGRDAVLTQTGETFNERAPRLPPQQRRLGHDR